MLELNNDDESRNQIALNEVFIAAWIAKGGEILNKPQLERLILNPNIALSTFASWHQYYWEDMRIESAHLPLLLKGLRIPPLIALPDKKGTVTGECALCMLLYFLANPRR